MKADFYLKARKWYNTIYVNPASERLVYFVLFFISTLCIIQSIAVIKTMHLNKKHKSTYVLVMDHKYKDDYIKVSRIPTFDKNDQFLNFLELIVRKYVINMESLEYGDEKNGTDAIRDKAVIIKNLSGKNVYDDYMSSSYRDYDSDMSFVALKLQKIVSIRKIEFLYKNTNFIEKLYSFFSYNEVPKGAKVYFTIETTSERIKKRNMVAIIHFDFYFNSNGENKKISTIDFKVNDYYVEKDITSVLSDDN